jgi:hypothetical protein
MFTIGNFTCLMTVRILKIWIINLAMGLTLVFRRSLSLAVSEIHVCVKSQLF